MSQYIVKRAEALSTFSLEKTQLYLTANLAENHENLQALLTDQNPLQWQINLKECYLAPEYSVIIETIAKQHLQLQCRSDNRKYPEKLTLQQQKN